MDKCRWQYWQGISQSVRFLACPQGLLEACGRIRMQKSIGQKLSAVKAFEMGVVDKTLPVEDVVNEAVEHADTIGGLPKVGYEIIKQNREEVIAEAVKVREDQKKRFSSRAGIRVRRANA